MSKSLQQRLLFGVLCLVWGSTWIAMKIGTAHVPPMLFAGLRWTTAGSILLAWRWFHDGRLLIPWQMTSRILAIAVLLVSGNQVLTLYSLRYVGSGLGAVINCALSPLSLLGFAVVSGQERISRRIAMAMGLGVLGIFVLFGPAAMSGRFDGSVLLGAFGIMLGTLAYSAGSVVARPLMGTISPVLMGGMINVAGGLMLLVSSMLFEPGSFAAMDLDWGWRAWTAWLFLVFPAALGASTIYLTLVRDWGASRAGSYAFVSPIVAVFLGLAISGEALHPVDAIGMVMMLLAAWVALRKA
jgi:drug/metabolite transporter (DMT)-like permease